MLRVIIVFGICMFLCVSAKSNNIRVDNLNWIHQMVSGQTLQTMSFRVAWENSWRDDYNYDAAYIFFKFKKKNAPATEEWHHIYLKDGGVTVAEGYDYWLSPLSSSNANYNTGIYIFRKENGAGGNSVNVTVTWDIKSQMGYLLDASDFSADNILIAAQAIEMAYIPRGPFRIGDGFSEKSFRRAITPILPEYDIVSNTSPVKVTASVGNGKLAADRNNNNENNEGYAWVGTANCWWIIDFGVGNAKKVAYFGVNALRTKPDNYPVTFKLWGGADPEGSKWDELWSGPGKDNWYMASCAYPVEKALEIPKGKRASYRAYRLTIDAMNAGYPIVNSIAMTERGLDSLIDHTVLIDGKTTPKDSVRYLGARDGGNWMGGTVPETFPNGYKGFYAMKYEISQEQYVRFLNKLSYRQQDTILGSRIASMAEGDYIFGNPKQPDCRNGIIISSMIEDKPVVFSNNLKQEDEAGKEADGQNVACNYMNIRDMLAYADWAGLRPLTEMEYEKIARPLYPLIPVKGGYAWNTVKITKAANLNNPGLPSERPNLGNANFGNSDLLGGPLRCGTYGAYNSDREGAGAGFWGPSELSGNLAEMYYNVNNQGLQILVTESGGGNTIAGHNTSHGDGVLDVDGKYNGSKSRYWQEGTQYIGLRGGSYADVSARLAISDRSRHANALAGVTDRQPTVTFRLGRSVPEKAPIVSVLTMENEVTTNGNTNVEDITIDNRPYPYTIYGNRPVGKEGVYTYLWYKQEEGELYWNVMEGENGQNLIFNGFRNDTLGSQVYKFRRKVVTPYADSETSSEFYTKLVVGRTIVSYGNYRAWADGTYARSAYDYRYPKAPYKYEGATGSGVYRIDPDGPDGPVKPIDVYCDMETNGGGWMLAMMGKKGSTVFNYRSLYWTNDILLNEKQININSDEDMKNDVFINSPVRGIFIKMTLDNNNKSMSFFESVNAGNCKQLFVTENRYLTPQSYTIASVISNYDLNRIYGLTWQQGNPKIGFSLRGGYADAIFLRYGIITEKSGETINNHASAVGIGGVNNSAGARTMHDNAATFKTFDQSGAFWLYVK